MINTPLVFNPKEQRPIFRRPHVPLSHNRGFGSVYLFGNLLNFISSKLDLGSLLLEIVGDWAERRVRVCEDTLGEEKEMEGNGFLHVRVGGRAFPRT